MNIYDATEQAYKNGKKEGEKNLAELEAELKELKSKKAKAEGLQTCVDCIHHNACKQWVDFGNRVIDGFNALNRSIGRNNAKGVERIDFPQIQEHEFEVLCDHFETKENETVQP